MKNNSEKGQAFTEFALILPLLFIIILFTIEVGWVMYHKMALDFTARGSSWYLSLKDYERNVKSSYQPISVANASHQIKNNIQLYQKYALIDLGKLEVTHASIWFYPIEREIKMKENTFALKENDVSSQLSTMIEVKSKLIYPVPLLTPVSKIIFGRSHLPIEIDFYKLLDTDTTAE